MGRFSSKKEPGLSRRRVLQAGLLGGLGLALYSGELERHWVEVTHVDMPLPELAASFDGMRVVQISDIHMDEFTEAFFLRHVVQKVNALRPEVILLTGDFVSAGPRDLKFGEGAAWQCAELLGSLDCKARYAVMGNHDVIVGKYAVMEALAAHGVMVLYNAHTVIERGGARWWLAGVDDPMVGEPDPEKAIPAVIRKRKNEPIVLMCHGPDYADLLMAGPAGQAVHLMLSGHTHGGQVRLPYLTEGMLPLMGQKYVQGWFRVGAMQLYVNRGIGTVGIPFRLASAGNHVIYVALLGKSQSRLTSRERRS